MKKNILTIIILAATLINVTLTAVTLFVVIPNAKKTDTLITKVLSVIDLELESPNAGKEEISLDDIEPYQIEEEMTINLKKAANDKIAHYAVVKCSISLNKKSEDYDKKYALLIKQESLVKEIIQDEISNYTVDTIDENKNNIKTAIREKLNTSFDSDFVLQVSFSTFIVQ